MTPENIELLMGVLGWAALIGVLQFLVLPTATESFRNRLFALRRELFLYMASGRISPKDPAYQRLRKLLNTLLRFAERVTLLRTAVMAATYDASLVDEQPIEAVIDGVTDEKVRADLRAIHLRVSEAILKHLVLTSPLGWGLSLVGIVYLAVKRGLSLIAATRRFFSVLPSSVRIRIRSLEEQAEMLAC